MRLIDGFILSAVAFLPLAGCIEPYVPQLKGETGDVYAVSGLVTNKSGYHTVSLSQASVISKPQYIPVTGAQMTIEDDRGNSFVLEEYTDGEYRTWIDGEFLIPGVSYRVHIWLPRGGEIVSDYDIMPECPELDSVYYQREEHTDPVTGEVVNGLQFYIDFNGSEYNSTYYRWSVEETWEYHSAYPIEYYYDGTQHRVSPTDYTYFVCWATEPVPEVFTLSTRNLVSNSYQKFPLHYVDNTTLKLYFGYSMVVTQYALSAGAYMFWEQLRIAGNRQGGLYEKQPLSVQGNLHDLANPEKKILGFFGASSVSETRINLDAVRDIGIDYTPMCVPYILGRLGWRQFPRSDYPVYFRYFGEALRILDDECVDCRMYGGTIVKPEFWPE